MTQSAIPKFRRQIVAFPVVALPIVALSILRLAMMPQVARANPPNHETRYVNAFTRLERVLALRVEAADRSDSLDPREFIQAP